MKHSYNLSVFTAENELSYYILGTWLSDGNISIRPGRNLARLGAIDKEWIENIRNNICSTLPITCIMKEGREPYYKFDITNKNITSWFVDHGCFPNKSLTIELPNCPDKYLPDLLRGCYDGDGWITIYQNKHCKTKRITCILCSSSLIFLEQILEKYFSILNIKGSITKLEPTDEDLYNLNKKIRRRHNNYKLIISGESAIKLINYMYYPNHQISLARKYELAKQANKYYSAKIAYDKSIENKGFVGLKGVKCKINWPSDEELVKMTIQKGFTAVGNDLGVSDSSVRHRLENRNLYEYVREQREPTIDWPDNEKLIELLNSEGYKSVATKLGTSKFSIRKRLEEAGLYTNDRIHWPSNEDLVRMINDNGFKETYKELNCSLASLWYRIETHNLSDQIDVKKKAKSKNAILPSKEIILNMLKTKTKKEVVKELGTSIRRLNNYINN